MKRLIITTILLVISVTALAQTPATPLKVGDRAPDFALPNGDGKLIALTDYRARGPVVIIFYRGFW